MNRKVTVSANFITLIKKNTANLSSMAKTQIKTDLGEFNALQRTAITILDVSKAQFRVTSGCAWPKDNKIPFNVVNTALNGSTTAIRSSILHLEWDGFWGGGAHAIGVIREDSVGSTGHAYTLFDPNYGLLRAYSNGNSNINALLNAIISEYSAARFLAMPLL